ncbi:glycosyl hydrolase-related protein [Cohnella sp. WQ 127256]|uniref:glycoside hydrolase family 38 N-terminal domain-containing protein n=1 Tax=Cohnella sp. WQ 127256 TaxID=2938790 RepID=UPI0021185FC4|nr:glycosyl hydrolase-related protein [Cohnella sp. WQ 127256]
MNKTYHFISHTHWDREWYLTFEKFRYRLVNLIDRLLDLLDRDPEFKYFHLDGQTIVLEDYAALRPNNTERLERYIREGRILIGPWFQQNDLYLTSGESTVRNLIEGIGRSRQLGGEMKIGYLPDHFGLIGQMPQIFYGVGLDRVIFGRGYDLKRHASPYFHWQSPDGSNVTGILMAHWYNNAQRLPNEETRLFELFDVIREREEKAIDSPHYAMMNGVDHLEAQYDLTEVLGKLRKRYGDEIHIVHDTLPQYAEAVRQHMIEQPSGSFETVVGELREGLEHEILAGTLSSRIYIKQENMACHDLIEKWMEPLSVWCAMLGLDAYESDTMRYVWKLYMENHPHDSICGCSQDAVHDHMMDRYVRVRELAEEVIDRKMTVLARQVGASLFDNQDQKLFVANTSQLAASPVIQTAIYFMESDQVKAFVILDGEGREIPYRVLSSQPTRYYVTSPINLPGDLKLRRYDIEWQPEVPKLGYATFRVCPSESVIGGIMDQVMDKHAVVLENEHIRVEVQSDGSFHLSDKASGVTHRNQGRFQDDGDRGYLYVFKRTEGKRQSEVWSGEVVMETAISNELYEECSYRFTWELPEHLNEDRMTRSDSVVPCTFEVRLRLEKGARQVNMHVEMNNLAKDHRIRVLFPCETAADEVWAGGQFDIVKRSWDQGMEWQPDANAQPFWKWFAPVSKGCGVAVFAKGIHEYEMTKEGRQAEVTLLRGVENINIREAIHLEQDLQPKGQCLGNHSYSLAIRPFASTEGDYSHQATLLYQEAELFHQGLQTKLFAMDERRWNEGRAWVQASMHTGVFKEADPNEHKDKLPLGQTLLSIDGEVMLSAVKEAEDRDGFVLRLFNASDVTDSAKLRLPVPIRRASLTNLLEEPCQPIVSDRDSLTIEVGPRRIETVRLNVSRD